MTSTAGGVGLHNLFLAKYLPRPEFDITVGFGPGYPLDKEIAELGVPVKHFAISRKISPFTNLRGMWQLYRFFRKNRFDIVCIACSIAGFIGRIAAFLARVPHRVFVIHLYASHPQQSRAKQMIYRLIERALDPLTTHYVAVSEAMKEFGVTHCVVNPEKVSVIYPGTSVSKPIQESREQIRAELGLAPQSSVVGTIARLEPQKGVGYFLQAARIVSEKTQGVEFLVVGDGPLREQLAALTRELGVDGCVKFVGWRRDVPRVLHGMDVFCLPSVWEALPVVLAEAMAMSRPVVAARLDGISEIVKDGKTGLLVRPQDPSALAEGISTMLAHPDRMHAMGLAGREVVEAEFTVDRMVARFRDLFQDMVNNSEYLRP